LSIYISRAYGCRAFLPYYFIYDLINDILVAHSICSVGWYDN
jgi:hypothetical protein